MINGLVPDIGLLKSSVLDKEEHTMEYEIALLADFLEVDNEENVESEDDSDDTMPLEEDCYYYSYKDDSSESMDSCESGSSNKYRP